MCESDKWKSTGVGETCAREDAGKREECTALCFCRELPAAQATCKYQVAYVLLATTPITIQLLMPYYVL